MKRLVYFADPMCSWCWGFSPDIGMIADRFKTSLPIHPVMGGLRPGTIEPMSRDLKEAVRGHWVHVAEQTGQRFDFSFFERAGFVYDTEPACRAVVVMRDLAPDQALSFMMALQRAFYADGQDITKADVLSGIAAGFGVTEMEFAEAFDGDEAGEATQRDFLTTQRFGVSGFPTLYAEEAGVPPQLLSSGYRKLDSLVFRIRHLVPLAAPDRPSVGDIGNTSNLMILVQLMHLTFGSRPSRERVPNVRCAALVPFLEKWLETRK